MWYVWCGCVCPRVVPRRPTLACFLFSVRYIFFFFLLFSVSLLLAARRARTSARSDSRPASSDLDVLLVPLPREPMLHCSAQLICPPIQHKPNISPHNDSSRIFNKRFPKDTVRLSLTSSPQAIPTSPSPVPSLPSPLLRSAILPKSASPMSIPSALPASASTRHPRPASRPATARHSSFASSLIEDVLAPGDIIGPGILLQGHPIRPVSSVHDNTPGIAPDFEVIRKLGTGSYAVVYLVREVLSRSIPSEDGHCGILDLGDAPTTSYVSYGREFALKCLSKANLDEDALAAQLSEVISFPLPYAYIHNLLFFSRSPFTSRSLHTPTSSPFTAPSKPPPSFFFSSSSSPARICSTSSNRLAIMSSPSPSPTTQLPLALPQPHPSSLLSTNSSAQLVSVSSPACSPRCAMPSQPATNAPYSTGTSSQRTSSSQTLLSTANVVSSSNSPTLVSPPPTTTAPTWTAEVPPT